MIQILNLKSFLNLADRPKPITNHKYVEHSALPPP